MCPQGIFFLVLVFACNAWQPAAIAVPSFTQPSVSYQWRPKLTKKQYDKIKFPIEYPLTVEMMQKGMPKLSPQELHRFVPLLTLLSQQQQVAPGGGVRSHHNASRSVTVASLGGSFALGTQCCIGNSWPNRFVRWLQAAFPLVDIVHLEYLKGSTNSLYGASIVRELFEARQVDLLLLGYALNDEVTARHTSPCMSSLYYFMLHHCMLTTLSSCRAYYFLSSDFASGAMHACSLCGVRRRFTCLAMPPSFLSRSKLSVVL